MLAEIIRWCYAPPPPPHKSMRVHFLEFLRGSFLAVVREHIGIVSVLLHYFDWWRTGDSGSGNLSLLEGFIEVPMLACIRLAIPPRNRDFPHPDNL